jgi:hypothetical protein
MLEPPVPSLDRIHALVRRFVGPVPKIVSPVPSLQFGDRKKSHRRVVGFQGLDQAG